MERQKEGREVKGGERKKERELEGERECERELEREIQSIWLLLVLTGFTKKF